MKIIELSNDTIDINECIRCPFIRHDHYWGRFRCTILDDEIIPVDTAMYSIHEGCKLKDK